MCYDLGHSAHEAKIHVRATTFHCYLGLGLKIA